MDAAGGGERDGAISSGAGVVTATRVVGAGVEARDSLGESVDVTKSMLFRVFCSETLDDALFF